MEVWGYLLFVAGLLVVGLLVFIDMRKLGRAQASSMYLIVLALSLTGSFVVAAIWGTTLHEFLSLTLTFLAAPLFILWWSYREKARRPDRQSDS